MRPMTPIDIIAAAGAFLGALSTALGGHIGWMLAFLLIGWLLWRLIQCERKHEEADQKARQLAMAVVLLSRGDDREARERAVRIAGIQGWDEHDGAR